MCVCACVDVDVGISANYVTKNGEDVLRIWTSHAMLISNGVIIKPGYRSKIHKRFEFPEPRHRAALFDHRQSLTVFLSEETCTNEMGKQLHDGIENTRTGPRIRETGLLQTPTLTRSITELGDTWRLR